ncbi:MAG: alpha/beta hydrolase [Candidatus Izimaplasma sp.]|nr:alpha/beta hydrolase [Candidatus Izimaplasma bacterium]
MVKFVELAHHSGFIRGMHHYNNSNKIVIFFHGFTGNKNESNFSFSRQAKLFDKNNIDSIRLDYFGSGDSDGQFEDMDFDDLIIQGNLIINYVKSLGYKEIYLEGMSMGGALAIKLTNSDIAKLILISPAINMVQLTKNIFDNNLILPNGNADLRSLELSRKFQASVEKVNLFEDIPFLDIPTLIIQGTNDQAVPYENALIVKEKIRNSKLIPVEGCDHLYSSVKYMNILFTNVLEFINN